MSTIETLEGLKRRITIKLDAEAVNKEIDKRLKDLSRRVRVDGFRPGKVPMKMVRSMHGEQVEYEVVNDKVSEQYREIMTNLDDIKPAGYPEIYPVEDKEYHYNAEFEVLPEFTVQGLDKLTATKAKAEVTDADLDKMIEILQKQQATWNVVEREAKEKDRLKIDFVGRIDDEEFDGGKGTDVPLVLGSNSMIPGFEDALVGVKAGEERTIDVTFPEDYQAESLQGKAAKFDVTIHEVAESVLPEVNEEFAKNFGIEDGNVDTLRTELKANMERELNNTIQNNFKNELMDSLAEQNEIEVPQALIQGEVQTMMRQSNFPEPENQEQAQQLMQIAMQSFSAEAEKRARLGLIVGELINEREIKLDDKYVDARLELIASTYEDPKEVIEHFRKDEQSMQSIRNIALEDQIVDILAESATITEEEKSFDDIMNAPR